MAKFEKTIIGNFDSVIRRLEEYIGNNGMTMNLVDESNCNCRDTNIAVRVYDKYFMRNGSRASLSLTVVGHGNEIYISAIGAGGGKGIFFNTSLGAEEDMVSLVQDCVQLIEEK